MREPPPDCRALLGLQEGVIARWQIPQAEIGATAVDSLIRQGRWQVLYRGVYATFTGPPSRLAVLWAAVLRAGPDAALSHYTAAELDALTDRTIQVIHVTVGSCRRIAIARRESGADLPSIVIHYSDRLARARHPSRTPPRTRVEETTLDLIQVAPDLEQAMTWLMAAVSRRITTPDRISAAMSDRPKLKWRREVTAALTEIGDGIHSALEWRYVRRVERPHGLPLATRQAPTTSARGQHRYFDNYYQQFGVAVELDGKVAHPLEARWMDIHRDNGSAALGVTTLRYSWSDVVLDPCRVAGEVARVLKNRGWRGRLRPCGPQCQARFS
jgi:hypothetical protein